MGRFWLLVVAWVHLLLLFGSSPSEGITSSLFHRSKPSHQCGTSYFATQVTSAAACGAICSTEDKCLGFSLGVAMNSKRRCEVVETSDNCHKNSNFDYYSRSGTKTTPTSSTPTTTATTTPTTTTTPPPSRTTATATATTSPTTTTQPPSTTTTTATTTTLPPTSTTTATAIPTTTTTPPPSTTPTTTATTTATTTTTRPASTTTTATTTTLPPSTTSTPTTPTTVTTPTSTTPESSTTLTTASPAILLEVQTDEVVTGIQTDSSKKTLTDLTTQQLEWDGLEYSKLEGEQCDANGAITATLIDASKFWCRPVSGSVSTSDCSDENVNSSSKKGNCPANYVGVAVSPGSSSAYIRCCRLTT